MVKHVVGCALLVTVLAGCGGGESTPAEAPTPPPYERPVAAGATRIEGGSAAQHAALRELLGTFAHTGLARLEIEPAGRERRPHPDDAVVLRFWPAQPGDSETEWEANLLGGEFAARSREAGLPAVVGALGPDGGGHITHWRRVSAATTPADPAAAIERSAGLQGVEVTGLQRFTLEGRPIVRARLRARGDAAEFLVQQLPIVLGAVPADGDRYFEAADTAGKRVTYAGRVGGWGMSWSDQELESCSPFQPLSYGISYKPRPCPFTGPRVQAFPGVVPTRRAAEVVEIAGHETEAQEAVLSLSVAASAQELCRFSYVADCPAVDGVAWLAVLADPNAEQTAESKARWLMIGDDDGRIAARGDLSR